MKTICSFVSRPLPLPETSRHFFPLSFNQFSFKWCFFSVQKVTVESGGSWPASLAEYIRHNDQILIEQADKLLSTFEEEIMPCESFDEFCDVAGLFLSHSISVHFQWSFSERIFFFFFFFSCNPIELQARALQQTFLWQSVNGNANQTCATFLQMLIYVFLLFRTPFGVGRNHEFAEKVRHPYCPVFSFHGELFRLQACWKRSLLRENSWRSFSSHFLERVPRHTQNDLSPTIDVKNIKMNLCTLETRLYLDSLKRLCCAWFSGLIKFLDQLVRLSPRFVWVSVFNSQIGQWQVFVQFLDFQTFHFSFCLVVLWLFGSWLLWHPAWCP